MHLVKCLLSVSECNVKESITSLPKFFPYKVFSFMWTFQRVYLRMREYFCACGSPKPSFTSFSVPYLVAAQRPWVKDSKPAVCARAVFPFLSVPTAYLNSPEDTVNKWSVNLWEQGLSLYFWLSHMKTVLQCCGPAHSSLGYSEDMKEGSFGRMFACLLYGANFTLAIWLGLLLCRNSCFQQNVK